MVTMFSAQQTLAAGFQLNAQSATGLGRAFSGDAVIADNASVVARNAAAMTLFKDVSLSLGFETITTKIKVEDATYRNLISDEQEANYGNAGDTSVVPNFYIVVPVNDRFAYGFSGYSNFGTKTEFSDDYPGYVYGGYTDLTTFNLGASGAYRIDAHWSFGAGIDLIYGRGQLRRNFNSTLANALGLSSNTALDVDVDGWGIGFNLGSVYEFDADNRFGFDYHYNPDVKAKGDIDYSGYSGASGSISDTLTMPLPDIAEFSGYHRLNDSFAIHYSIQWINWSEFNRLVAQTSGVLNSYNWQDGWHYAIGTTYYLNPVWTLRAGYLYDTSAQNEIRSISVPDSNRQWLSIGATYHINDQSTIDAGFTYLLGQDVSVSESRTSGSTEISSLQGTTHADAILFALQYSHRF
jgi:long-chain fatty acid transport protein